MTVIYPFLKDPLVFGAEMTHAMGGAFDEVCRTLLIPDDALSIREAIAAKIIEQARFEQARFEHAPDHMRDAVLRQIGAHARLASARRGFT